MDMGSPMGGSSRFARQRQSIDVCVMVELKIECKSEGNIGPDLLRKPHRTLASGQRPQDV